MLRGTIFLGADHAGFKLKEKLKPYLLQHATRVVDLTPSLHPADDYPLIGRRVAQAVAKTNTARGVLICGSGVGVTIAANRVHGARAFVAHDAPTTRLARRDDDVNLVAFSGWLETAAEAKRYLDIFFKTKFSTAARHRRRVKQLE